MDCAAALAYAQKHELHALLVAVDGAIVFERYGGGYEAGRPHALYSGAKSFWGIAAAAAQDDGLLALDEPVALSIPAWDAGAWKRAVTLRHLLSLTSGIGFGGLGNAVPAFGTAAAVELKGPPGVAFTYGGIPFQVFGEVLRRKLLARKLSPHDYLRARVLDPIGCRIAGWRTLKDGSSPLPTGAAATAREWLKFGELIRAGGTSAGKRIVSAAGVGECLRGSPANPRYGLGCWLGAAGQPRDLVYASGAGGQAMYICPTARLVAVHFGNAKAWRHETFLKRLGAG